MNDRTKEIAFLLVCATTVIVSIIAAAFVPVFKVLGWTDWMGALVPAFLGLAGAYVSLTADKRGWFVAIVLLTIASILSGEFQIAKSRRDAADDAQKQKREFQALQIRFDDLKVTGQQNTNQLVETINKYFESRGERTRLRKTDTGEVELVNAAVTKLQKDVQKLQELTAPAPEPKMTWRVIKDGDAGNEEGKFVGNVEVSADQPIAGAKYFVLCDKPCKGVRLDQNVTSVSMGTQFGHPGDRSDIAAFIPQLPINAIPAGAVIKLWVEAEDGKAFHILRAGRLRIPSYGDK